MPSFKRIFLSRLKVKPDKDQEKTSPPFLNDEGYVDFRPGDVDNPRNWSRTSRWYITIVVVCLATNGNLASSLVSSSTDSVVADFRVSEIAANLPTTLFLFGYCAGPFLFAPLSEFYGRRWILHFSFLIYMAFLFLCAFPSNFGGMLVGRLLAGTFISASLSIVPGILVDLWDPIERGNAMAIFSLGGWVGPIIGSIVSGFMQLRKNWRWGMYAALWAGAVSAIFMFTLPETHGSSILEAKAHRARKTGGSGFKYVQSEVEATKPPLSSIYKIAITRPWALLFDLISFLCSLYISIVFTLQFMLFSIYPIVFRDMRGWNAGVSQLPLIGQIMGGVIAAAIIFIDSERRRRKDASGQHLWPEDRLLMAMVGGVGFPITMFLLAWTAQYDQIHWIVPTIAGMFLSTSLMLIFVAYINYLTDTYADYAASAIASNTVARSAGAAAAPLFTTQMFNAMGIGGGGSLIAGVATLLAFIPFLFYWYGGRIRKRSKYALTGSDQDDMRDEEADPTAYQVVPEQQESRGQA